MRAYRTGILISEHEVPNKVLRAKNWHVGAVLHQRPEVVGQGVMEWVVYARDFLAAQSALALINCSAEILLHRPMPCGFGVGGVVPDDEKERIELEESGMRFDSSYGGMRNAFKAICVAVKSSYRVSYKNALARYYLSRESWSVPNIEIFQGYNHFGVSSDVLIRMRYAGAIVFAYGVIEELGLAMRAGVTSRKYNKWIPSVRSDLEERLVKAGCSLDEPFYWIRRGKPTSIERGVPFGNCESDEVRKSLYRRDGMVELADAVSQVSFLRSKVSAHGGQRLVSSLTGYDVFNSQMLARRLFLSRLGFWKS